MIIKLPLPAPILMMCVERINVLDIERRQESVGAKARRNPEDRGREVAHLLILLNGDIDAQRAAAYQLGDYSVRTRN